MLRETLKSEIEHLSEPQLERLAALIAQMKAPSQQTKLNGEDKPFWQKATPQERAEEILKWSAQQSRIGISLPDEAFDRGTIYD